MKPRNTKNPGELPPIVNVVNLSSKTVPELCELRDRQAKLLNNRPFINNLTDKGAKIRDFHEKIVTEIIAKQNEDETCRMLENMVLSNVDNKSVQQVEWTGKLERKRNQYLDSDDDSDPEDVLLILSQSTAQEKIVKVEEAEKVLVTPEDLLKIGEIPHVKYIVDITELNKQKQTERFKPYKTTISDVHNPSKEIHRKQHKHWEVTAATPPPSIHGPAKVLTIEESLKLQKAYNIHIKEIEAEHAAEKLLARVGIKMVDLPKDMSSFKKYREVDSDDDASDLEGSDKEVHDDEPDKGGVVFTVMN